MFFFFYRYAFTPLLDAPDDDGDETELFIKEIYNGRIIIAHLWICYCNIVLFCLDVKMRSTTNTSNQNPQVTPYKDYPTSNSSTKSQSQLVCKMF